MSVKVKIFVSYSHQDAAYLGEDSLLGFLRGLEREDVEFWLDEKITTGDKWDEKIKTKIKETDIALVLVSQAFLDSPYCMNVEIREFLQRSRDEGLIIFPIILSACEWKRHEWLKSRQFLPGGNETIEEHYTDPGRRKRLFLDIRENLRKQIDRIRRLDGRLLPTTAPSTSAPNPFIWRAGITDAEYFFDRDNEQRTLRAYLHGHQNCQIVGPRRIGKTSLLLQIERVASNWEKVAVVAHLDLQDPRCFTLSGWLGRAGRKFGWQTLPTSLAEFADCVDAMLLEESRPVLCLDEFEELTLRRTEFTRDFFLTLRSCSQRGMSIVITSRKPLSDLTKPGDLTSPFYNTFPLLPLGPFADTDVKDFVTLYRAGVPSFTPAEKEAILEFAKGHPLALQVACFHVLQAKENGERLATAMRMAEDDMKSHLLTW